LSYFIVKLIVILLLKCVIFFLFLEFRSDRALILVATDVGAQGFVSSVCKFSINWKLAGKPHDRFYPDWICQHHSGSILCSLYS